MLAQKVKSKKAKQTRQINNAFSSLYFLLPPRFHTCTCMCNVTVHVHIIVCDSCDVHIYVYLMCACACACVCVCPCMYMCARIRMEQITAICENKTVAKT